jgi:DNA integrity scanning protein DisA with diadenylate cyclase activity
MMSARVTRTLLARELENVSLEGLSASDYGLRLQQLHLLDLELRSSSQRLAEASNFVANLSGTDGAIVMRTDLSLVGFGAEIMLEAIAARPVYEVWEAGLRAGRALETEQFGMRHRSAMRLCAASKDVSVFVVSQDGAVSLVFSKENKVYIRRNITTVNANM